MKLYSEYLFELATPKTNATLGLQYFFLTLPKFNSMRIQ